MKKNEKIILYQVLPRLFGNKKKSVQQNGNIQENGVGKLCDFTEKALQEIKKLGITHIWYTGIIAHATLTDYSAYGISHDHHAVVKGRAGSPYAIKDYYDVDPDLAVNVEGRMQEFEELICRTHDAGMKVIIDFVPNHVARQYHSTKKPEGIKDLGEEDHTDVAFSRDNNFYYLPGCPLVLHFGAQEEDFEYSEFPAKVTGNDCFSPFPSQNDWYETIKLNYGVDYMNGRSSSFDPPPNTWYKMQDILLFWISKGVDGFRCDMAELVPVEFWHWVIPRVKSHKNVLFIAEVYNPSLYRSYIDHGAFDYLYDKVGLYDTLRRVSTRQGSAKEITSCREQVEGIKHQMLSFLENHDEQRIASDFFAGTAQAGVPGMIVTATIDTNPTMIYFGQELGERGMDEEGFSGRDGRTTIFDYWRVESVSRWVNDQRFNDEQLSEEQKTLQRLYTRLLTLANQEQAITRGAFYDLMGANDQNSRFHSDHLYAFLRKHEDEVLLIVVNFDTIAHQTEINLPTHAFESLMIPDNRVARERDLMSGEERISTLTAYAPYGVTLAPQSGKILKFDFSRP